MKYARLLFLILLLWQAARPSDAQAQTGKNEALETLGSVSGMMLYNTYVAIGAIADGFEAEAYDAETVTTLMSEQKAAMTTISASFDDLLASGFITDANDKEYIAEIKSLCGTLGTMANNLSVYCNDVTDTNADAFQATRTQAWDKIAELLGIEE